MTCTNCGSAFHEKWACTKPLKVAEEAISTGGGRKLSVSTPAATGIELGDSAPSVRPTPPVDTAFTKIHAGLTDALAFVQGDSTKAILHKRGRPKTITDMRTYKANKAKQYRAKAKEDKQ